MAKIVKVTLDNETAYPVTITDAVYDLNQNKLLSEVIASLIKDAQGWNIAANSENPLVYELKNAAGEVKGTVTTVQETYLDNVSFDSEEYVLTLTFNTSSGKADIPISLASLKDVYTNGNGLSLEDNKLSIKIHSDSADYLSADEDGLKLNLSALGGTYLSGTILSDTEYDDITTNFE